MFPDAFALARVWHPAQPAAVKICSPRRRAREACLRERSLVLARLGRREADVGGHVARVVARDELGRHRAVLARVEDLLVHDPLDGLAVHPVGKRGAEGRVEVGPGRARGPARPRMWHDPHCSREQRLAVREVGLVAAAGRQRQHGGCHHHRCQQPPCRVPGEAHGGGSTIRLRGRDHALRDALPGVSARRLRRQRAPGALPLGGVQGEPGHQLLGDLLHRPGPTSNESSGRSSSGNAGASVAVTSAIPEWPADSGSTPHAAASAATIPNASGKVLGITWASQAGSRSGRSSCSSRPVKWIRPAASRSRGQPLLARAVEEGAQVLQLAGRPALELAPARRDVVQVLEVAPPQGLHEAVERLAVGAEPHDHEARVRHASHHQRPGGHQQVDPLRHDQLADEAHDPVAVRVEHAQRGRGALVAAPGGRFARLQAVGEAVEVGRAGAEGVHVHARRARAGSARAARARPPGPPRGSRPCAATPPGPTPRRAPPRARTAGSARGSGGRCTRARCRAPSSRTEWRPRARARGSPGSSRGGSRGRGRTRERHGRRPHWRRCSGRARRRSAPGTAWRRRPRSGRPRRPAAPGRCPGCGSSPPPERPSRGPGRAGAPRARAAPARAPGSRCRCCCPFRAAGIRVK